MLWSRTTITKRICSDARSAMFVRSLLSIIGPASEFVVEQTLFYLLAVRVSLRSTNSWITPLTIRSLSGRLLSLPRQWGSECSHDISPTIGCPVRRSEHPFPWSKESGPACGHSRNSWSVWIVASRNLRSQKPKLGTLAGNKNAA